MRYRQKQSDNNLYSNSINQKLFQEGLFLMNHRTQSIDRWRPKVTFQQNIANLYFEDSLRPNHCQQLLNVSFLKVVFLGPV